jgi:hypothetical protein
MKDNLRISKELIQYLEKTIILSPDDLKHKDFDRGFKAGQLEVLSKLRVLLEQQERKNPHG